MIPKIWRKTFKLYCDAKQMNQQWASLGLISKKEATCLLDSPCRPTVWQLGTWINRIFRSKNVRLIESTVWIQHFVKFNDKFSPYLMVIIGKKNFLMFWMVIFWRICLLKSRGNFWIYIQSLVCVCVKTWLKMNMKIKSSFKVRQTWANGKHLLEILLIRFHCGRQFFWRIRVWKQAKIQLSIW